MDSNSNSTGLIDSHYFGVALVAARMSRGISQSRLGILAACNVTSLRKIEKGMVQPGVSTAIRLVAATGESVGAFFQKLAEDSALSSLHGTAAPGSSCASPHEDDAAERTCDGTLMDRSGRKGRAGKNVCSVENGDPQKVKALFGPLFRKVRERHGVTQKAVANAAQYNLRNLFNVEAGSQEPGVMVALAMVCATGCDVRWFFSTLAGLSALPGAYVSPANHTRP